ncbi:MAG: glycoside hydrolase family 18 [Alistipes sp.]|nr:glycoside hydrolase family 18 [Alistipes sp.]
MKKKILSFGLLSFACLLAVGCSDWTDTERKGFFEPRPDEYYQVLREWKKTDHSVTFGWFGNWTGQGASLVNCLMGLPDSVDFVSMWGNWYDLSPEKWADKNAAKEIKGTRVLMCFIIANCGEQTTPSWVREQHEAADGTKYYEVDGVRYATEQEAVNAFWGWDDDDESKIDAAIAKYAKSLADTMDKYQWDGFDWDYEANWGAPGNLAGPANHSGIDCLYAPKPELNRETRVNFLKFVKEMSKYVGPKSGTGRLFVIDGEPQTMHPDAQEYFDYYIIQAYNSGSYSDLDNRYNGLLIGLEATQDEERIKTITEKLIFCENFEDHASTGGVNHLLRTGGYVRSLAGMAMWEPPTGYRKGGVGAYHIEYEYKVSGYPIEYPFLREASRIMNPPMTSLTK